MRGRSSRQSKVRPSHRQAFTLVGIFLGNALEWFDFVLFGYFATVFARLFFPTESQIASIALAFGTFALTFLVRPFGAIVLGAYGDRYGRKSALILSTALITVGTGIIAILPSYSRWGAAAPLILMLARTIQGFSAGGEFGSVTAFLAESSPSRRGFLSSLQFSGQGLTALLAASFGAALTGLLTTAQLYSWGWRLPFLFGVVIGPITYFIRLYAAETPEFRPTASPLKKLLTDGLKRAFISAAAVTLGTVITYTIVYLPSYAHIYLHITAYNSFLGGALTGILLVCLTPIAGALSDRYGRLPTIFPPALIILLASYPIFAWLAASPSLGRLLIVQSIIGCLAAWYLGVLPSLMSELFPAAYRTTGLSVSYAFAVTTFGGGAPLINTLLIELTGNRLALSFYLMAAAVISLIGLIAARQIGIGKMGSEK